MHKIARKSACASRRVRLRWIFQCKFCRGPLISGIKMSSRVSVESWRSLPLTPKATRKNLIRLAAFWQLWVIKDISASCCTAPHRTAISALTRCVLRQLGLSGHGICASQSSLQDEMPIVSLVMPQRQEWCGGGLKSFLRARHAGTPSQPARLGYWASTVSY